MSKDAFYFSHDSNASQDPKILQMCSVYKAEGYGWYWMIVEMMRDQENYKLDISGKYAINSLAIRMYTNLDTLVTFLDDCVLEFKLFSRDDVSIWSESLIKRMSKKDEKSEKARQSVLSRWGKKPGITEPVKIDNTNVLKTDTKEKEEEINKKKNINNIHAQNFELFWSVYPKKKSKGQAEKFWLKIKPSEILVNQILTAIAAAKLSYDWMKEGGKYIPYPGTWLNAKGWNDEYKPAPEPEKQKGFMDGAIAGGKKFLEGIKAENDARNSLQTISISSFELPNKVY